MITIIIPVYNHLEDTKKCLKSIYKYTDPTDVEIIVVANGCTDGTVEWLKTQPVHVAEFKDPIGFPRAINEGIKLSQVGEQFKSSYTDYVVILNNDTVLLAQPKNQWLDMLKAPYGAGIIDDRVGVTGPMMCDQTHIQKKPNGELHKFIIFFCAMIPRRVLDDVGLMDEDFSPGFCEDNDWCIRAENKGYKIVQVPNSNYKMDGTQMIGSFPIYHAGNKTFKPLPTTTEGFARNIAKLKEKYPEKIDINGAISVEELEILKGYAKSHAKILEIGSWFGRSTRCLAENTPGIVYAVDTWKGTPSEIQLGYYDSALKNEGDFDLMEFCRNNFDLIEQGKLIPIRMSSKNACEVFKQKGIKFDMIFIDADHTYEGVKADIISTKDLLLPGALLCGHDYNVWPGVKQAVDEMVGQDAGVGTGRLKSIWMGSGETVSQRRNNESLVQLQPPQPVTKRRVFDCVLFYNELELLEMRLNELDKIVDKFIVIEAPLTTTGLPKPLYLTDNIDRFKKFKDKLQVVVLDLPNADPWTRERFARDKFKDLVQGNDDDVVLITDLDEIPNADTVQHYTSDMGLRHLDMRQYSYWLNCYQQQWDWAKIIGYKDFKNMTPCQIRYTTTRPTEGLGGWHFGWMGGTDRIVEKIQSWAHTEYNRPDIIDKVWIEEAINAPKDVLKRPDITLTFVDIDETYPKYLRDNLEKYKSWIK